MYRYYLGFILLLLSTQGTSQVIQIEKGSLISALKKYEEHSGFTFNYDPALIKGNEVEEDKVLDFANPEQALNLLLQSTQIDYEIQNNLIYLLPHVSNSYRLCGRVLSKSSGEAISFAHVYIDNFRGIWTNDEGRFELQEEGFKNEKLKISCLGYEKEHIFLGQFKSDCVDIYLDSDPNIISNDIIIRDYLFSPISRGKEYGGIDIDLSDLNRELGAIDKDVFRTIQFLPGVTSLDETASNLTIRGAQADQSLIVWEDVPLYSTGHFFGMISSVNPFVIDKLKVQNGVYNASYDNRIGGIIDMSMTSDIPDRLSAGVGATMTEAHADVAIPIVKDKVGLITSIRSSLANYVVDNLTYDRYKDKIILTSEYLDDEEEEENELETDIEFYDFNAKLIIEPTADMKFSSSYLSTGNSFQNSYDLLDADLTGQDFVEVRSNILSNKFHYNWSDEMESSIQFNLTNYHSEYLFEFEEALDVDNDISRASSNEIRDLQFKYTQKLLKPEYKLELGYVYDNKTTSYQLSELSQYEDDYDLMQEQNGVFHHFFLNYQKEYKRWLIDFGSRMTYINYLSNTQISPRLSITRPINDQITFRFSTGLFNQSISQIQSFNESSLNFANKIWVLGQAGVMRSNKFNLGGTYDKNGWLFDLDSYIHNASSVPVISSGQSSQLRIDQNGSSVTYGLESLIKKRWNNLSVALSYHMSSVRFNVSEVDEYFPANNDQRHNISLVTHYRSNGWNVGFQYALRSGLPFTEINGLRLIEESEEDYYELEIDGINDARFSAYQRLDLMLGYKTQLLKNVNVDIQISLLNALDFQNELSSNHILSDRDLGTPEPEIFEIRKLQLRRTPQLLCRFSF